MNILPHDYFFNPTLGEPVDGENYLEKGWVYRDLPRLSRKTLQDFIDLVGGENYSILTFATYTQPNGDDQDRGQILLSPEAQQRIADKRK